MPRIPSNTLLAKDAVGQAMEIAGIGTDLRDRELRINDYNMAVSEVYLILGHIDTEAYLTIESDVVPGAGDLTTQGILDISIAGLAGFDKIVNLEAFATATRGTLYSTEKMSYDDFVNHKETGAAIDPYERTVIYTLIGNAIHTLIGEDLSPLVYDGLKYDIIYRRQPSILLLGGWDSEKVDLPDKYWSLLVNRIASLIEWRKGITQGALASVKMTYEQLLANVEPALKSAIIESIDTPPKMRLGDI